MITISFSTLILVLLSLAGFACCLYLGFMQFRHRSNDSSEEQLSHQFFSGMALFASALVWGISAWSISSKETFVVDAEPADALTMIKALPATAAGIPPNVFTPAPLGAFTPLDEFAPHAPVGAMPFPNLHDYEQARHWLSKQLVEAWNASQAANVPSGSHSGIMINLNQQPGHEAIRTLLQAQPELLSLIYYPPQDDTLTLLASLNTSINPLPTVFLPKSLLGQIYYTPLQGDAAPIVARLVKAQIRSAKIAFY